LKKNGSIDAATTVTPSRANNFLATKSWLRWYVTPCGKLARSGTLLALKMPRKSFPLAIR
jgi:hypothetical protein